MKEIQCCFCGKTIPQSESNNPKPANTIPGARCCYECNEKIVIPVRKAINSAQNPDSEPVPGVSVPDPARRVDLDNPTPVKGSKVQITIDPYLSGLIEIHDNLTAGMKGIDAAHNIETARSETLDDDYYLETVEKLWEIDVDITNEMLRIISNRITAARRSSKEVAT